MTRDGFAGESGGVELGSTLNDRSIDGYALAWLDYDDASARHLIGVYLLKVAFGIFDVCIIGRDIHHGANGLAALSYGVGLEELPHLVKSITAAPSAMCGSVSGKNTIAKAPSVATVMRKLSSNALP